MRLVFAGTPSAAVPTLRRLAGEHDIVAVVTRPDAPLGRKRVLTPSPVAAAAAELGLPIIRAAQLDAEHGLEEIMSASAPWFAGVETAAAFMIELDMMPLLIGRSIRRMRRGRSAAFQRAP